MDEKQKKELMEMFKAVVKQTLDENKISYDAFMKAVEEKFFPPQRKYNIQGAFTGTKADKEAVTHIGKMFIALRNGDTAQLKQLSEGVDEQGGYLVPEEVYTELIRAESGSARMRDVVRVLPVKTLSGRVPKRLTGALLVNVDELGAYGDSGAVFGQVPFKVHKFGAIIPVSNELASDSPLDMGQFVMDEFRLAADATENAQSLMGIGGDKDAIGIFNQTSGYTRVAVAAAELKYDDMWKRFVKLKAAYKKNAKWLMSTDGMLAVGLVKDTTEKPIFVANPTQPGEFLVFGKPVEIFDEIPTTVGKTQIALGDWKRAYYLFDRQQISLLTTNVGGTAFTTGTTDTRADVRFDGAPADTDAAQILFDVPVPA